MKKIVISQRRDKIPNRDEERDGVDVKLASILYDLGFLPIPLCSELHDAEDYITALKPDAILISGGNDIGERPQRDKLETRLLDYSKEYNIPVLGICRGMQMINHYLGGTLSPVIGHVATRQYLLGEWAKRKGYKDVNSYHNLAITQDTIAAELDVLATTKDGVIKAIKHKSLPWFGIMWHPERERLLNQVDLHLLFSIFGSGLNAKPL